MGLDKASTTNYKTIKKGPTVDVYTHSLYWHQYAFYTIFLLYYSLSKVFSVLYNLDVLVLHKTHQSLIKYFGISLPFFPVLHILLKLFFWVHTIISLSKGLRTAAGENTIHYSQWRQPLLRSTHFFANPSFILVPMKYGVVQMDLKYSVFNLCWNVLKIGRQCPSIFKFWNEVIHARRLGRVFGDPK